MLILAHRGYHATLPENTLEAFAAAVELGVDGIETDVRTSRDGEAVVIHDRLTRKWRPVSALTRREIEEDMGRPVPLLAEALELFADVLWNVEIKTLDALAAAFDVLKSYQGIRRLLVTSFRHDVVMECARRLDLDCGLLFASRPLSMRDVVHRCLECERINSVVWDYNIVDGPMLDDVAAAGWDNYVYGAVTAAEHERCRRLGLEGLITDYPGLVLGGRNT